MRLSSIDPRDTPLELAELMRASEKLCPHLHLSLQSGNDGILKAMKRGYTTETFADLVRAIRERVPQIGLSTDVIVGFPGEDDTAFENTKHFVASLGFHKVHVFPYSERDKTSAVRLPGKVTTQTVRRRAQELTDALRPVTENILATRMGQTKRVAVEYARTLEGLLQGWSEDYVRCVFEGDDALMGSLQTVVADRSDGQRILARLL